MVQCIQCKTMNQPKQVKCTQCGADLLPGRTKQQRLSLMGLALLSLILGCVIGGVIMQTTPPPPPGQPPRSNPAGLPSGSEGCGSIIILGGLGAFVFYLWRAIGPTPLHARYALRAERHESMDNERADVDYGEAIRLAPERSYYRYKRGLFYEKLGKLNEARKDLLEALELERKRKDADVTRLQIEEALQRISSLETSQRRQ